MYLIQSRQTLAQLPIRVFHAALSLDPDSLHPGPILLKGYVYINCIDIWSLIRRPNFSVYWMMKKVTVEQSNNVFMCIVFYSVTSHSLCKIRRPPPLSTASLTQSSNMLQWQTLNQQSSSIHSVSLIDSGLTRDAYGWRSILKFDRSTELLLRHSVVMH